MQVTVNGKIESVDSCSILEFVKLKGLTPEKVVVEHNRKIVKRDNWSQIRLQDNDSLEVIALVGGG